MTVTRPCFTAGDEATYDAALAKGPVQKIGRRPQGFYDEWPDGYPGGWVFTSLRRAKAIAARHGYAVYELAAPVEARRRYDGELHLDLDADIVRKVAGE